MNNKHLEFINGIWCVVDNNSGEVKGNKQNLELNDSAPSAPLEIKEDLRSQTYLDSITLNTDARGVYPYRIISPLNLRQIDFAPITIFYGGNGSGKSTLLNIIAEKVGIKNKTEGNTNSYFSDYVAKCSYQLTSMQFIPEESKFLRSEDIMNGIVKGRKRYLRTKRAALESANLLPDLGGAEKSILESFFTHPDELSSDDRFFLSRCSGVGASFATEAISDQFESNGEIALTEMQDMIMPDCLYFLDEPEVSLSPKSQQKIVNQIYFFARFMRAQFIIATHSPFFLSLEGARIYDLDSRPVAIKQWYELANIRAYFELFDRNREKFLNQ